MAAPAYCMFDNTEPREDGFPLGIIPMVLSSLEIVFPFGCAVIYFPSQTKQSGKTTKWEGTGKQGIFAGYHVGAGYTWSGQYLVCDISEIDHADLAIDNKTFPKSL